MVLTDHPWFVTSGGTQIMHASMERLDLSEADGKPPDVLVFVFLYQCMVSLWLLSSTERRAKHFGTVVRPCCWL